MPFVSYNILRGLELEGRHPHDVGGWHLTIRRLEVGEGLPLADSGVDMIEFRDGEPFPPAPKLPRSSLVRYPFYRRIRSAAEAERHMQQLGKHVPVCVHLFSGWANPPVAKVIPMPREGERPLPDTHLVPLVACWPERRAFAFQNSWGEAWGDKGFAALSYDYVDKYAFEIWVTYDESHLNRVTDRKKRVAGRLERRWVAHDESFRRVYGFELWDENEQDRQAWSFVVERDEALEVEELYVRPEFRRNGLGRTLATKVRALADAKRMPLRAWVPFADSRQENPSNYPALVATARSLRVQFQSCPTIWAAYYATDERSGSGIPVEPFMIPPRPKSTLAAVLAAALSVTSGEKANPQAPLARATDAAVLAQNMESFPKPGTVAWDQMNRRRGELVRKKNRQGLNDVENAEYESLQRLVQTVLDRRFPAPSNWDERIARIEKTLDGVKRTEPE
jgi:GNAT superfamily N-acetyltransferase